VDDLLDVHPRPEHLEVMNQLAAPGTSTEDAGEILLSLTAPGKLLDPANLGVDVVWAVHLPRLRADPRKGSLMARQLFVHLERLMWQDAQVCPVTVAVAAYFAAGFELLRGRHHHARRMAHLAAAQVDFEKPAGLSLLTMLRFAKLWVGT
jgi:hypothetical protein